MIGGSVQQFKIDRLGAQAFVKAIGPLKKIQVKKWPVVGFDTEYTSNPPKGKLPTLLSFQLWHLDRGIFVEVKPGQTITPEWLYAEAVKLIGHAVSDLYLVTYFSPAELQFLPVREKAIRHQEYSKKSVDATFACGHGRCIHIYDLFRWFDGKSLASASESMGLEKLEGHTKRMTRKQNNTRKGREYARHDAYLCYEILERLRHQFLDATGVDPLIARTPASASAKAFRRLYVKEEIFCGAVSNKKLDANRARLWALRACWGGKAEVTRRGKLDGIYTEFDLSAAYPRSVIALVEMPCQKSWQQFRTWRESEKMIGGFCRIRFKFPAETFYPCLPVMIQNVMVFPLSGSGYCTLQECREALKMGAEISIIESWGYRTGTTVLRDYMQWCLEQRAKSKEAQAQMFKLLANAIIGKFAQRIFDISLDDMYDVANKRGWRVEHMMACTKDQLRKLGVKEKPQTGPVFMPEWNGLICGYTRAALAQMLLSGRGVYCATDSVWCKKKPQCDLLPFGVKGRGPVTIIRTRLASMGEISSEAVRKKNTHLPHHSIGDLETAVGILQEFEGETWVQSYLRRRPLAFKEAVIARNLGTSTLEPYTWVVESRKASTFWDAKRELLSGGHTRPWSTPNAYLDAVIALRRERAQECPRDA